MEPLRRRVVLAALLLVAVGVAAAQPTWHYHKAVSFDAPDSTVSPLLCATDASGNLWVISSNNVSASGHNALYKKAPADTILRIVEDYTALLDPNVNSTRGIATIGDHVFVSNNKGTTATAAVVYVYRDGDPAKREAYGSGYGHAGYGTSFFGLALTRDTVLYGGLAFGTSFRVWNYNSSFVVSSYASYIAATYLMEPGGPHDAGVDIIRDVATIRNGDYTSPTTVFYTTRNSSATHPTSGGIALWIGGTQTTPGGYRPKRVTDFFADLALGSSLPYGIATDGTGNLYVCGTDTLRRWVRGYAIDTSGNSTTWAELPSQTDASNPNPAGAPFNAPSDIAFSPDYSTAYVTDVVNKKVYVFGTSPATSVEDAAVRPTTFDLGQNYPNPFNPFTNIQVRMAKADHATLRVYDMLGRPVATLVDRELTAGTHTFGFDAAAYGVASGVYYYRLSSSDGAFTRKMILSQ